MIHVRDDLNACRVFRLPLEGEGFAMALSEFR